MNIDSYNENLRAADAARAFRRPQPSGLAGWQARQKAREDAELAPYAIVKDGYEYCVTFEGKGSSVNRFRTRREALEAARELKARYDAPKDADEPSELMKQIMSVYAMFA